MDIRRACERAQRPDWWDEVRNAAEMERERAASIWETFRGSCCPYDDAHIRSCRGLKRRDMLIDAEWNSKNANPSSKVTCLPKASSFLPLPSLNLPFLFKTW